MAEAIPRSRPVITGFPRSFGSFATSQEAKKESPSMWRMARGKDERVSGVSVAMACSVRGGAAQEGGELGPGDGAHADGGLRPGEIAPEDAGGVTVVRAAGVAHAEHAVPVVFDPGEDP